MQLEGHVQNGAIILNHPVPLPEGARVRIEILPVTTTGDEGTLYDSLQHLIGKAKGLPPDASVNHDHYLYGVPKKSP